MSHIRIQDLSRRQGAPGLLRRIEADLARIVGPQGTQALMARSRQLAGVPSPTRAQLLRTLLQLVRKFLGQPLVAWLLQSAAPAVRVPSHALRLR